MRGLYIHIPFCIKKCLYCAFNSYSGMESIMETYSNAVISEILSYDRISINSIYIGGGTPTVMPGAALCSVISAALSHFSVAPGSEVTVEANPKTITKQSLTALKNSGVNRISLGVQSLSDGELCLLGRAHSGMDALNALRLIKDTGFTNFSADIMFALPRQSIRTLAETVNTLISYQPAHFSAYSLSVDEGTYFAAHPPSGLPEEDTEREMYYFLADTLKKAGYRHYELSNFAKPGMEAVHNTKYWLGEEYIGVGAGAHSYYLGKRFENPSAPEAYLKNPLQRENVVLIDEGEKRKEHYMLGLRLLEGVREIYHENITPLINQGLIFRNGDKIRLTEKGIDLANYVMAQLM